MTSAEELCREVLKRITPTEEERKHVLGLAEDLMARLRAILAEEGLEAEVCLEGSLAKDTWLSGEADVDIFVRFRPEVPRKFFKTRFLELARQAAEGYEQVERYAEHPYLECLANGVRVNIVPCYAVAPGEWLSATDRTPYHTDYVRSRLDERLKGEVRLMKKFMKGIGAYGAELRVGGFSGYLCELLVLYYGGFLGALKGALRWRKGTVIDPAGYYEGREEEARELFRHHLIVVDPVDAARNAAASVRLDKMAAFVAAAREFLARPSEVFFFPSGPGPTGAEELAAQIRARGTSLLAVHVRVSGLVPDVLWGQLYRSLRGLRGMLRGEGFTVLRASAWSDERENCVLLFELESLRLPPVMKHVGPPIWVEEHSERFLAKHTVNPDLICGPYVEGDRWVVLVKRKWPDAVGLLKARLADRGGRNAGVAPLLADQVEARGFRVIEGEGIAGLCRELEGFGEWLADFLAGRPRWLARRA